jgi:hypothetical protein
MRTLVFQPASAAGVLLKVENDCLLVGWSSLANMVLSQDSGLTYLNQASRFPNGFSRELFLYLPLAQSGNAVMKIPLYASQDYYLAAQTAGSTLYTLILDDFPISAT